MVDLTVGPAGHGDDLADAVDRDLDGERYQAAFDRIASIDLDALPPPVLDKLAALSLRCRVYGGEPVDQLIIDARRLLLRVGTGRARAAIHAEIAFGLAAKRAERLARREADAALAEWPEGSLGPAVAGWIALQFDRRDDAIDGYTTATQRLEPYRGWIGLARARYVTGDFAGALAALDPLGDVPRTRIAAIRVRADLARVRGEWDGFLALIDRILDATPGGDLRRHDLLDRASALFALGRRDSGLDVYRALWRDDADDAVGRFAREVLDTVERRTRAGHTAGVTATEPGARVLLPRFPTVAQKRNHCGPASLELVLRAQGIAIDQDDIAPEVAHGAGSSTLALTRYLEARGLATRRFEGNLAAFRACLELGLPVIVEQRRSTSSHVAVVIGVDEDLGLLFVQDPTTHVTSERLATTQARLGAIYRNAALVALRADDPAAARCLDAAGVVDRSHLRLIDSCAELDGADRPTSGTKGAGLCDDTEEVLRRCNRALAEVEDYPLAWYRRTQALLSQMLRVRTPSNVARFVGELRRVRLRYHDQAWPHALHGAYLMSDGRHEEALIELETALRLEPEDADTAQDIAECLMQLGRRGEARAAFWAALRIDPGHVHATESFATLALDSGELDLAEHLSACALELAATRPFNHLIASRVAAARGRHDDALRHARRAVALAPDYAPGQLRLAGLLGEGRARDPSHRADHDEAGRIYQDLAARHPYWAEARWRAARHLERAGQIAEATRLLAAGITIAQEEPALLLRHLTEILLEAGDDDGAVDAAERFAEQRPTPGMLEVLWQTLDDAGRPDRAAEAAARFLSGNETSPFACVQRAARIYGLGGAYDDEAERLLRRAVLAAPPYGWARRLLAELLATTRPDEAIALLAAAPPGDPWNDLVRASLLADQDQLEEARAAMAGVEDLDPWSAQEVWNRLTLGGDAPGAALDRLPAITASAPRDLRARLAFALASGRGPEADAAFAALPLDDPGAQILAVVAADADDRWRDELTRRIAAQLNGASLEHGERRRLQAIHAGNAAAAGDRTALDRLLRDERNPVRIADALASLHQRRQRDLVLELRDHVARLPVRAATAVELARAASMRGDHQEAIQRARAAIAQFPRGADARAVLAIELALIGDDAGATRAAEAGLRLPTSWVHAWEAAALTALLAGDRATALCRAERARRKAAATGYGENAHGVLAAVRAALRGDAAGVDRARNQEDLYVDPAAPLWLRLRALAGADGR